MNLNPNLNESLNQNIKFNDLDEIDLHTDISVSGAAILVMGGSDIQRTDVVNEILNLRYKDFPKYSLNNLTDKEFTDLNKYYNKEELNIKEIVFYFDVIQFKREHITKAIRSLILNGRCMKVKMNIIISTRYTTFIPPFMKRNFDYIFLFAPLNDTHDRNIIKDYKFELKCGYYRDILLKRIIELNKKNTIIVFNLQHREWLKKYTLKS
jgi:hypothetical protein